MDKWRWYQISTWSTTQCLKNLTNQRIQSMYIEKRRIFGHSLHLKFSTRSIVQRILTSPEKPERFMIKSTKERLKKKEKELDS